MAEASRQIGVTQQTFYQWRTEYGGSKDRLGQTAEATGGGERPPQESGGRSDVGQSDTDGGSGGKLLSPSRRRQCVEHVREMFGISERRACKVLGHPRFDSTV